MIEKQPREMPLLYVAAAVLTLILWNMKLALEQKLGFTVLLIVMVLIFGQLFYWLDTLKMKSNA